LPPHSFFWFELPPTPADTGDVWQAAHPEFTTLVMPHGWGDLFSRHNLPQLERDASQLLPRQRWFAAKDRKVEAAWVLAHGELAAPAPKPAAARRKTF
jgi:maltose alpha-D-glucosyltransferase/alpha-amylase